MLLFLINEDLSPPRVFSLLLPPVTAARALFLLRSEGRFLVPVAGQFQWTAYFLGGHEVLATGISLKLRLVLPRAVSGGCCASRPERLIAGRSFAFWLGMGG